MKWERVFEFSASVDDVWLAFVDPQSPFPAWNRDDAYRSGGAVTVDITAEQPNEKLEWRETEGDNVWDMSVTFEASDNGTRITIVRSGFGTSDEWRQHGEGRLLGWEMVLADLEVYFRTGEKLHRFYPPWGTVGFFGVADGGGMRVTTLIPGRPASNAGVQIGDIVVRIAKLPIYGVADMWSAERFFRPDDEFQLIRGKEVLTLSAGIPATA